MSVCAIVDAEQHSVKTATSDSFLISFIFSPFYAVRIIKGLEIKFPIYIYMPEFRFRYMTTSICFYPPIHNLSGITGCLGSLWH